MKTLTLLWPSPWAQEEDPPSAVYDGRSDLYRPGEHTQTQEELLESKYVPKIKTWWCKFSIIHGKCFQSAEIVDVVAEIVKQYDSKEFLLSF